MLEGVFSGRINSDTNCGLNGGVCMLRLAAGAFELQIVRYYIYSIENGDTLRGSYTVADDRIVLDAREHYSYSWETIKQETTKPVSRKLVAKFAGPELNRTGVLDMRIDIDWPFQVLLLLDGETRL